MARPPRLLPPHRSPPEPALGRRAAGSPPFTGGPGKFYVVWAGRQLSLLGGRMPIATSQCDRRRAITYSCASMQALNSKAVGGQSSALETPLEERSRLLSHQEHLLSRHDALLHRQGTSSPTRRNSPPGGAPGRPRRTPRAPGRTLRGESSPKRLVRTQQELWSLLIRQENPSPATRRTSVARPAPNGTKTSWGNEF